MSDNAPPRTASDVLYDLHNYLSPDVKDVDNMSAEEIRAELKQHGIDSKKSFSAMKEWLTDCMAEEELTIARRRRLTALDTAAPQKLSGGALCEKIHNLLRGLKPQDASAYFSRFESASEEDLQSLHDDLVALSGDDEVDEQ